MLSDYYLLGRSGLRVSRLALGAMTFGGWGSNESTGLRLFNAYVDAGGNFIDTADIYVGGQSEELVGRFTPDISVRGRLDVMKNSANPASKRASTTS